MRNEQTVSGSDHCKSNQPVFRNASVHQTKKNCEAQAPKSELRKFKLNSGKKRDVQACKIDRYLAVILTRLQILQVAEELVYITLSECMANSQKNFLSKGDRVRRVLEEG